MDRKKLIDLIISIAVSIAGIVLFIFTQKIDYSAITIGQVSAIICFILFIILVWAFIPTLTNYFREGKKRDDEDDDDGEKYETSIDNARISTVEIHDEIADAKPLMAQSEKTSTTSGTDGAPEESDNASEEHNENGDDTEITPKKKKAADGNPLNAPAAMPLAFGATAPVVESEPVESVPEEQSADTTKSATVSEYKQKTAFTPELDEKLNNCIRYSNWRTIIFGILICQIVLYVIAYLVALKSGRIDGGLFDSFARIWCHGGIDAPSYLGIAENWYVTTGDPRFHIVFFPLYPLLVKLFSFAIGNYLISAVVVSTLSSLALGIAGYELVRIDYGEKIAARFTKFMFVIPASFFFFAPMTESIFVLLCLLCLIAMRKRKFWLCAIFGALASFTRSPGVLLIVPVFVEYVRMLIEIRTDSRNDNSYFWKKLVLDGLCILGISVGLLAYLGINYSVWGNALQFSVFQREHWSQSPGFFYNSAETVTNYLHSTYAKYVAGDAYMLKRVLSLWLPEIVFILLSLPIVAGAAKKLKPQYSAYFIVYYIFTIGATWLLSAPRYLMASIALPLSIALLCDDKWKDLLSTLLCGAFSLYMIVMFALGSPMY